jgi:carbamoyl-phosphate synthase large subunit
MQPVVLFSSVGRRAQLIECFRESLRDLGFSGGILGMDCSKIAPAAYLVDEFFHVPCCTDPEFVPRVLDICLKRRVNLVVPTIDTELAVYAACSEKFARAGIAVLVSSPETVEICSDKIRTHDWFVQNGLPTVRQATPQEVLRDLGTWRFPLIAKPRWGSASAGVVRVYSAEMLLAISHERHDLIIQELAIGQEHTVNLLVDRSGQCVCAVPHLRMEVRAGEVSKATTVKHAGLMDLTRRVVQHLPDAYGPLNIQAFIGPENRIMLIEINPRFGGGFPLAFRAGAHFPRWILEELLGIAPPSSFTNWQEGLAMFRYDTAVFLPYEVWNGKLA